MKSKTEKTPALAVVTRNYLNDLKGYAVRKVGKAAAEFKEIFCVKNARREVTYNHPEFKVEENFGCGVVIVGEPTAKKRVPIGAVRLTFDYNGFYTDGGDGDHVREAKEFYFTKDGVFAVL